MKTYLQTVFTLAKMLTKRFFRDKTAMFFTFAFPLIFLFVFGGLFARTADPTFAVALINRSDSEFSRQFMEQVKEGDVFEISEVESVDDAKEPLSRGEHDVILELPENFGQPNSQGIPSGTFMVYYDESDQQLTQTFTAVLQSMANEMNTNFVTQETPFSVESQPIQTANLTSFDYLFSGLLGFTILSLGLFGLANGFPADKKAGVFSRLRSTPLRPSQLILATALQYLLIGLIAVALMFVIGILVFDFNMRGDYFNFAIMIILSIVLMFGFGLAIAGWAKNENQAAPVANLLAFPMMFLSGVFFPRFLMPEWLQGVASFIPLSPIIDGMRKILTEGQTLLDLGPELLMIGGWIIIIYALAAKTFSWE